MSDILEIIKNKKIIIYGAGYIANKFYDVLMAYGLEKNIDCFVVTQKNTNQNSIKGYPLKTVYELENIKNSIICLAVHEMTKEDIIKILKKEKLDNYIWIFPYFFELILGTPIATKIYVPVSKLIQSCNDYRLAVRYLAIENYFGKNNNGFMIYKKALGLYCKKETIAKRLNFFCDTIQRWEKNGYLNNYSLIVDDKYTLLDGAHRLALARYYQIEKVVCDIYKRIDNIYKWIDDNTLMTRSALLSAGFSDDELIQLESVDKKIREY